MATKNERLVPYRAIHPGEILGEELKERGIKQKDFAKSIGVQPSHLNDFIKGRRNLTTDFAMKLEKALEIPYDTWMKLHDGYMYDLNAIREKADDERQAIAYEAACDKLLNLKNLYKRIGVSAKTSLERVRKLKETFSFDLLSAETLSLQVAGMYKHREKVQIDDRNMRTWLALNWLATSQSVVSNDYKRGNADLAAVEIARMANDGSMNVEGIRQCLDSYGIAYLEVPKIDKAPIDAYSTISNGHPCITVTYRYNDRDKLAFDILHELCHIGRHLSDRHRAFITVEGSEYSSDPKEREAYAYARQALIPDNVWDKILRAGCDNLTPYSVVMAIGKEAIKYGVSPSIAISRYKHDTGWYRTSAYKSPKIFA